MHSCVGALQWADTCPPQSAPSTADLDSHLLHGSLGSLEFALHGRHPDRFSRFWTAHRVPNTDKETRRRPRYVRHLYSSRPHLCTACRRCCKMCLPIYRFVILWQGGRPLLRDVMVVWPSVSSYTQVSGVSVGACCKQKWPSLVKATKYSNLQYIFQSVALQSFWSVDSNTCLWRSLRDLFVCSIYYMVPYGYEISINFTTTSAFSYHLFCLILSCCVTVLLRSVHIVTEPNWTGSSQHWTCLEL